MSQSQEIFVFGSNLAGRHGRGSAYHAKMHYGARYGIGFGRSGNSYAIPTKDERLRVLPISRIKKYVLEFIEYAKMHPELTFKVVRIGCGLAGYSDSQMAPLFQGATDNCIFDSKWKKYLTVE